MLVGRVGRVGLTCLKGARHLALPWCELTSTGPTGDRELCLVDPARERVVRTVENPTMVQVVAHRDGDSLRLELPSGEVTGVPEPTGELVRVDYWGRVEDVELLGGPWAAALSDHLGHTVQLARVSRPGAVVYAGPVSLVTRASLDRLSREVGVPVEAERFRATFVLDDVDHQPLDPHVEDAWAGRELRLGEARVRVRGPLARCAVVDLDPLSGLRDVPVLEALARYRRGDREIYFGVDAEVTVPGRVSLADRAVLERD